MKYTAITIGPIHKTMQSVKSTKALWGASYLFSYIMRQILYEVSKTRDFDEEKLILPKYDSGDLITFQEAGYFPDRFIYQGKIEELPDIIDRVIADLAVEINKEMHKYNVDEINHFLSDYLRIILIEVELNEGENVIFAISQYLDAMELQTKTLSNVKQQEILINFLENYQPYNFLHKKAFGKEKRFPSTAEISSAEFKKESFFKEAAKYIKRGAVYKDKNGNVIDDQLNFYKDIKDGANDQFRNYQKYIAIIQADGDNIGKLIQKIYEEDKSLISLFSRKLLDFSKEAVKLIEEYNGSPVYAGGDDLLFFAPVAHTELIGEGETKKVKINKTFFDLIDTIDDIFKDIFYVKENVDLTKLNGEEEKFARLIKSLKVKPSMSYGISVSYYKFPLGEALEQSINQLFYIAKKTSKKDAVSYAILKHSGQYFGTTFHKDSQSFKTYQSLLTQKIKDSSLVHSIAQKLEPQNQIIKEIGKKSSIKERIEAFDHFFDNNYNEDVHREWDNNSKKMVLIPFLKEVKQLFIDVFSENPLSSFVGEKKIEQMHQENMKKLYAALRFIEFIQNKEER